MKDASDLTLLHDSLLRRMRTMHSLYVEAVDTMDLEQVNHVDQPGRLPIAFSLFHYINVHDFAFVIITEQPPIWSDEWQSSVQMALPGHGKGESVDDMSAQRIGNLDAFADYQRAVLSRTETHIEAMDPADFERIIYERPYPPEIEGTYSARCSGPDGLKVLDAIECWMYQHGLRHMGEIELARGFQGLAGLTV